MGLWEKTIEVIQKKTSSTPMKCWKGSRFIPRAR